MAEMPHAYRVMRWNGSTRSRIVIALEAVAVATAVRLCLDPAVGHGVTFGVYFLAVAFATALAGGMAGLLSAFVSTVVGWYFMVPGRPIAAPSETDLIDIVCLLWSLLGVGVIALISSTVVDWLRETRARVAAEHVEEDEKHRLYADYTEAMDRESESEVDLCGSVTLRELLMKDLKPHATQLSINGCNVRLKSSAAARFALMVHELKTISVNFGALSMRSGRIAIDGRMVSTPRGDAFVFTWVERGGPGTTMPARTSMGTAILKALPEEAGAAVSLDYKPTGLNYTCVDRLARIVAAQPRRSEWARSASSPHCRA